MDDFWMGMILYLARELEHGVERAARGEGYVLHRARDDEQRSCEESRLIRELGAEKGECPR